MTIYHEMIIEATGCDPADASEIEDTMRHIIFHSTLDWQTRDEFNKGAREAAEVLEYMRKEKS